MGNLWKSENNSKLHISTRQKLVLGIVSMCLVLIVGVMGIFAATTVNVGISTSVGFTATDIDCKVYVRALHYYGANSQNLLGSSYPGLTRETENPYYPGQLYFRIDADKQTGASSSFVMPNVTLINQSTRLTVTGCTVYEKRTDGTYGQSAYYQLSDNPMFDSSYVFYEFKFVKQGSKNIKISLNPSANAEIINLAVGYDNDVPSSSIIQYGVTSQIIKITNEDPYIIQFVAFVKDIAFNVNNAQLNFHFNLEGVD